MGCRLTFCLLALALTLSDAASSAQDGSTPRRAATATIEEVRQAIHDHDARLVSLKAEFRSWHRANLGTARHEHYVIAARDGRRFHHLWHGEYADPEDDPRAYIQLLDGVEWNVYNTYFRRYDVSKTLAHRPYTDKILFHPFFESLGWWPPGEEEPSRRAGRRIFLGDLIDDERCRVMGQELVEGAWCHVVEVEGSDRVWVDCTRGVVPRRTFLDARGDHPEVARYESSDFREVAPGLFLPYRLRRTQPGHDLDFITVVDRYDVNGVKDDPFRIDVGPGTLIYDRDTDTFGQVPGGFFLMGRLEGWVRALCPEPEPSSQPGGGGLAWWGWAGIAIGGLASGFGHPRKSRDAVAVVSESGSEPE